MVKGEKNVEATVEALVQPIVEGLNLELVGVEFVKEGAQRYLRLFIDKPGGVSLDDCEAVSRTAGPKLDEADPIAENYFFEVSSPGVERPLKRDADFARYAGQKVEINTFAPVDGQKVFVGELLGLNDGKVRIKLAEGKRKGQETEFDLKQIAKAKLRVF